MGTVSYQYAGILHVNIARRQLKEWFNGSQNQLVNLAQKGLDFRAKTRLNHPPEPLPDLERKLANSGGHSGNL